VKLEARDLRKLWPALAALALGIALGATAAWYSQGALREARAEFTAARAERNGFDAKLRRARGEEAEIRDKAALYNRLEERGLTGGERRLEWVELLNDIRIRLRLIEMDYEFAPRRALSAAPGEPNAPAALYASGMKLEMRLLHEEDLTRFLEELRRLAPALILARRCAIERRPHAMEADALRDGLLRADCLLDWITLGEAAPGGEGAK
jgi:hypothetical protein